jgi:hypothetical protein
LGASDGHQGSASLFHSKSAQLATSGTGLATSSSLFNLKTVQSAARLRPIAYESQKSKTALLCESDEALFQSQVDAESSLPYT